MHESDPQSSPAHRPLPAAAVVVVLFIAAAIAAAALAQPNRAVADERDFHLPTIRRFAHRWPRFDLRDYPSATTPGYHLVIAGVQRYWTNDPRALRVAGAVWTVGLLATLAYATATRAHWIVAVAICLPMLCSVYTLPAGVWLLPDNAGWWGVLGVLLIALRPWAGWSTCLAGGAMLLGLVLVRQIHLWAGAALAMAAWLGPGGGGDVRTVNTTLIPLQRLDRSTRDQRRRLMCMIACCLPAVAALAFFFTMWRGAVPPSARALNAGANPAGPAMSLAVFGILAPFYAGFLLSHRTRRRGAIALAAGGAVVGLLAATLAPTDYNVAAGRWSGVWGLTRLLPAPAHRSILILLLAPLGGAALAGCCAAVPRRDGWILITAFAAFTAAHAATHEAYQRYYEPFCLILLSLIAVRASTTPRRWAAAGPLLLALLLAAVTIRSLA